MSGPINPKQILNTYLAEGPNALEIQLAKLAKPLPGLNLSGLSPLERLHADMGRRMTSEESAELEAKMLAKMLAITLEKAREIVAEKRKALNKSAQAASKALETYNSNILAERQRTAAIIAKAAANAAVAKAAAKAAQNRMNRLATTSAAASSSGSAGGRRKKSHKKAHKKHARRTRRHR